MVVSVLGAAVLNSQTFPRSPKTAKVLYHGLLRQASVRKLQRPFKTMTSSSMASGTEAEPRKKAGRRSKRVSAILREMISGFLISGSTANICRRINYQNSRKKPASRRCPFFAGENRKEKSLIRL